MNNAGPIGVFDSGVGGLTIARELRARLPAEPLLYFADTAWVPYGGRPLEVIRERTLAVGRYLEGQGAKAVVVACNTACGAGLEALREAVEIPVIGVEPAIKPAVALSQRKRVGLLATEAMLRSERLRRLVEVHAAGAEVIAQACPGLVELVESGSVAGPEVESRIRPLVTHIKDAGADVVVLGCTHYPFLVRAIQEVLGPDVQLVESGAAVARQTERVLRQQDAFVTEGSGSIRVLTSGEPEALRRTLERLWGGPLPVERVPV